MSKRNLWLAFIFAGAFFFLQPEPVLAACVCQAGGPPASELAAATGWESCCMLCYGTQQPVDRSELVTYDGREQTCPSRIPVERQTTPDRIGQGPVQCRCVITLTPEDGAADLVYIAEASGISEDEIKTGVCEEYRLSKVQALEGRRINEIKKEVTGCSAAGTGSGSDSVSTFQSPASFGYRNPLGSTNVPTVLGRAVRAMIGIMGALFLAAFIWGGLLWMTAGGDADRVGKGKKTLINAVIGLLVVGFSYTILATVINIMQ